MKLSLTSRNQGTCIKEVYIDNSCNLRLKMQRLFGPEVKVYLDLFHDEVRVAKTLTLSRVPRNNCGTPPWSNRFGRFITIAVSRTSASFAPSYSLLIGLYLYV